MLTKNQPAFGTLRRSIMPGAYTPEVFTRLNLHLHALLLENQPWFCARDLGRLMGVHLNDRMVSKLDKDRFVTTASLKSG